MDQLPTILLYMSVACLLLAFLWYQLERIERAASHKEKDACADRFAELRAASARLGATVARLEALNARSIKALPVKTMAEPKRKPANKTAAKR